MSIQCCVNIMNEILTTMEIPLPTVPAQNHRAKSLSLDMLGACAGERMTQRQELGCSRALMSQKMRKKSL